MKKIVVLLIILVLVPVTAFSSDDMRPASEIADERINAYVAENLEMAEGMVSDIADSRINSYVEANKENVTEFVAGIADERIVAYTENNSQLVVPEAEVDAVVVEESAYASNPEGWWNALWRNVDFNYDVYARSTMQRGFLLSIGGGVSFGVVTDMFRFDIYGQTDYFFEPLGGKGGAANLEMDAEVGITLGMKIVSFWSFDTYIACDLGYYMQFLKTSYQNQAILGFNGLMIRPKLLTDLKISRYYGIMLGVYYQIPVYPMYSDYSGFGIMLSIA